MLAQIGAASASAITRHKVVQQRLSQDELAVLAAAPTEGLTDLNEVPEPPAQLVAALG